MLQFIREYLLAVQYFTRIPITGRLAGWVGFSSDSLRAAAAHFPGVGMLVGAVAAAVYGLVQGLLPDTTFTPLVAAALSTVATVLLTGGFHEDGLADVADGLGGSYDRERSLAIMKDSRVGAFGALALALALLCKVSLLAVLGAVEGTPAGWDAAPFGSWYVCTALWCGHVVSRGLPLVLVWQLPHVGNSADSKSKPLADRIAPRALMVALAWCVAACLLAGTAIGFDSLFWACATAAAALAVLLWFFNKRLQGFTGDCLGAAQQVCEIAFYLGLAASL